MLKITPYLGIIVLIVSIGGIFYPKLGYFLLLVFTSLMTYSSLQGQVVLRQPLPQRKLRGLLDCPNQPQS